jgi:hypothetical protein
LFPHGHFFFLLSHSMFKYSILSTNKLHSRRFPEDFLCHNKEIRCFLHSINVTDLILQANLRFLKWYFTIILITLFFLTPEKLYNIYNLLHTISSLWLIAHLPRWLTDAKKINKQPLAKLKLEVFSVPILNCTYDIQSNAKQLMCAISIYGLTSETTVPKQFFREWGHCCRKRQETYTHLLSS